MERVDVDESLMVAGNWKVHGALCKQLYGVVHEVMDIFPVLEAARHGSSSGVQALCSLRIAVEKAKDLLQYCSECSKLYLAITADCVLTKFEKARSALLEILHLVEETVPESITSQIPEIIRELEEAVLAVDQSEKQTGDEVLQLIQNETAASRGSLDDDELETFHQAALQVGITSSRAALTERRALRRLLEGARADGDERTESIALHLLQLMRKYSKLFRSETTDYTYSGGSTACSSPTVACPNGSERRLLPRLSSFNLRQIRVLSGSMPVAPEELRCPISLQVMYDPVVISSGQTYERACIRKWFDNGNRTCPKTRQQLSQLAMTPNYCVKGLITSWCEQNGVPVPSAPPGSPKLSCWRLALSERRTADLSSRRGSETNGGDRAPPANEVKVGVDDKASSEEEPGRNSEADVAERRENWLAVLTKDGCVDEQRKAVEQIRFLLKDDEELRKYMGAHGFTEPLVQFVRMAVCKGDEQAQEVGAMALFNLAVNNDGNKKLLLSAGVIPLLEEMTQKPQTCEAATAMYLNLSCLGEAKPVIGSSQAVPFLIKCLRDDGSRSDTCRLDALLALYNLSLHPPNVPYLLSSGIVVSLHAVLTPCSSWTDKALAVLVNLAMSGPGKEEVVANSALVGAIVAVLDNGEAVAKEKAASCLWIVCSGDEASSYVVLQEGAIPALVSLAANGTPRARERAQRLLKAFREQRQRELDQVQPQVQLHEAAKAARQGEAAGDKGPPPPPPRLNRSRSKRFGRALTCLLKNRSMFWSH